MLAVILTSKGGESASIGQSLDEYPLGLGMTVIASGLSGLSGALTQKALSATPPTRTSMIFSMELSVYGILFLVLSDSLYHMGEDPPIVAQIVECVSNVGVCPMFNGWTMWTFVPVIMNVRSAQLSLAHCYAFLSSFTPCCINPNPRLSEALL